MNFFAIFVEKKQFALLEIPCHESLGQPKMLLQIRHFFQPKLIVRKDRNTHSVSIISMV